MKQCKRFLCVLLALVCFAGLLPADAVTALGVMTAQAYSNTYEIKSYEDWEKLFKTIGGSTGGGNFENSAVVLTNDIVIPAGAMVNMNHQLAFQGTFDGQGHTITIKSGAVFEKEINGTIQYAGLFPQIGAKGVFKNVCIVLEGPVLTPTPSTMNVQNDWNSTSPTMYTSIGLVTGLLEGTIENVAVVKSENATDATLVAKFSVSDTSGSPVPATTYSAGILAGTQAGGTIRNCYSSASVEAWLSGPAVYAEGSALYAGGLVGNQTGGTIESCLVRNAHISTIGPGTEHTNKNISSDNGSKPFTAEYSGGIAGRFAGTVRNCVADGLVMSGRQHGAATSLNDSSNNASAHTSLYESLALNTTTAKAFWIGRNAGTLVTSYAYDITADISLGDNSSVIGSEEEAQAGLGSLSNWLVDDSNELGLSWMYQPVDIQLNTLANNADVEATFRVTKDLLGVNETTWTYTAQAQLSGTKATPVANDFKSQVPVIEKVEILEDRTDSLSGGNRTYYSGGKYQFHAKITGNNLNTGATVHWELVDVPTMGSQYAATVDDNGLVTVNSAYYGTLTLRATATVDEASGSGEYTFNVQPAGLSMLDSNPTTVQAGCQAAFGVLVKGYADSDPQYGIDWSVTGGGGTATIGTNGVLDAGLETPGTQLTVTAKLKVTDATAEEQAQLPTATATITVTAAEEVRLTATPAEQPETLSAELKVGNMLQLTVDTANAPVKEEGYTITGGDPVVTVTSGAEVLTGSWTDNPSTFTAAKAGSATIEVTRTFTKTPEATTDEPSDGEPSDDEPAGQPTETTEIVWTSTVSVTVTGVSQAANQYEKLGAVNGSSPGTAYSSSFKSTYAVILAPDAVGCKYQFTLGNVEEPGEEWLDITDTRLLVPDDISVALTMPWFVGVNLWMYTPGDETLGDSRVVKYFLSPSEEMTPTGEMPAQDKQTISITGKLIGDKDGNLKFDGDSSFAQSITLKILEKYNQQYGTNFNRLDLGLVTVTVTPDTTPYRDGGKPFQYTATASVTIGPIAAQPTINPRQGVQLTNNSFSITVPDDTTVYYKIFTDRIDIPESEYPTKADTQYQVGTTIPLPAGSYNSCTVVAIAYPTDETGQASTPDIVTFNKSEVFNRPEAPGLQIGDSGTFNPLGTYLDGSTFQFSYTLNNTLGNGMQVYYTTNGIDPVVGTSDAQLYDPSNAPTLNFNVSSQIVIKAVVYDPDYQLSSDVATFTVTRRVAVDALVPSLENNSVIRPTATMTLELPQTFVDQLVSLRLVNAAQYATYVAGQAPFQFTGYEKSADSDEPIEGVRYLLVNTGNSVGSSFLPTVKYLFNDKSGDLKTNGSSYQYAVCQIWADSENPAKKYYRFTNPDDITLTGESDQTLTLRTAAFAPTGSSSYSDGVEATFTYTVRGTVAAPTSLPKTDSQGSSKIKIGDIISLLSSADTQIYYTTDGTSPTVTWDEAAQQWTTQGTTQLYTAAIQVTNYDASIFILNALAVSTNFSLETSPLATFVYTIEELPKAEAPTAVPETSPASPTQLARDEKISLHTSTLSTAIYYTIDGSLPDYNGRDAWDQAYNAAAADKRGTGTDGTRYYLDDTGNRVSEPSTYLYDMQAGIPMAATQDQPLFVVTAMAVDTNRQTPATSSSDAVSYTYQLAKAASPTASPTTSDTSVTTIEPGTLVTLTTTTAGANIYYTTDTTLPNPAEYRTWKAAYDKTATNLKGSEGGKLYYLNAASEKVFQPSTMLYSSSTGITMPKDIATFFTVRAVAAVENGSRADSDVATYSYQLPAPVQAVYANPVDGTAVQYGATVTLACSTKDAQIFYKIYDHAPGSGDAPVVNKDLSYTEPISITKEVWIQAVAVRQGVESVVTTYHYTVAPNAAAPTASLPSGSTVGKGTRIKLEGEGTIIFTTDGSDPKSEKSATRQYGNTVNIDGSYGATVTVRAYIEREGYTTSDTVSFSYTICKDEDYLKASVASGSTVANSTSLTLSTGVTGGKIFYTLNGTTPQINNVYTASADKKYTTYEWSAAEGTTQGSTLTLSGNPDSTVTIQAIVAADGGEGTIVKTFTYKFQPQAAAPTASIPTGAVVFEGATVTLSAKEGTIYYTTDGSDPTTSSNIYSQPIDVSKEDTVLKAIAVVDNKAPSAVAEFRYTRAGHVATPTFSVEPGEIDVGTSVAITTTTEGATIYYSTDGTTPTPDNLQDLSLYVAPISITRAVTIRAIAVSDKLDESGVAEATYTVREPAPATPEQSSEPDTHTTVTDRLTSRRTYNSVEEGPTYDGVVLRESAYNTVLSAEKGVVPDEALLTVTSETPSRNDETAIQGMGQDILCVYNATLTLNGDPVTPTGTVELGFAIPAAYQNGVVNVRRLNEDGTMTQYTARRAGGMAYIETDSLGRFVLSAPQQTQSSTGFLGWLIGGTAVLLGLGLLFFVLAKRRKEEEATPHAESNPDSFHSLADFMHRRR